MKKLFTLVLAFFAIISFAQAQDQATPRTEYSVSVSEKAVTLAPGETKQITVSILRSKSFASSLAKLGLSSTLPAGITVSYEPSEGVKDSSIATISASKDAPAGEYQIILKSTVKNLTKGTIVKVTVGGSSVPKDAVTIN